MRNLSAVLTVLTLGSSTLAMADPDHHWRDRDDDRSGRFERRGDYDERVPRDRWQTLATHVRLEGRHSVRIELKGAQLHSVALQALRGGAHIFAVGVIYWNKRQASWQVQRDLDARTAPNMRIDLGPDGMDGVEALVIEGQGDLGFRVIGG